MASGSDVKAATCSSYPYTLTNGQTADANQVMANFNCAALTSGATIASPTISSPTISNPTVSGTLTAPDSGTWTSSGIAGSIVMTGSGTGINAPQNTAETLFTAAGSGNAAYMVWAGPSVSDASYGAIAVVSDDGGNLKATNLNTAANNATISVAGSNVQYTQTGSAAALTVAYSFLRIK